MRECERYPTHHLLQNGDQHAESIIAQDRTGRDRRDVRIFGNRDGEAREAVDVQHHVHVRTAVADVNKTILAHRRFCPQFIDHGYFAVTRGKPHDGLNLTGFGIVTKPRAVNMLGIDDTF